MNEADNATARLYRLSQAKELIWAAKNHTEPPYDKEGHVIPSKLALRVTAKEHPELLKAGYEHSG